jgi:hypothetical protein
MTENSALTISIMTISIMTISLMTISLIDKFQHSEKHLCCSVSQCSYCHFVEHYYADSRYAKYPESYYAESHNAECHCGALLC